MNNNENVKKLLKRIKWKNDSPATEKQVKFATSLLKQIKAQRRAFSVINDAQEKWAWKFWEQAELPENLTKIEASNLIEMLKSASFNRFASKTPEAVLKLLEGGGQIAGPSIIATSVFLRSSEVVVDFLAEFYPGKLNESLKIRAERK